MKRVHDAPKQLRSELFPDGLPFLQHEDKQKTEAANLVYEAVANIVAWCSKEAIPVIVENPLRSYMWLTSAFRKVNHMLPEETIFQNCMHGSSRDKWTLLKGSTTLMAPLALLCDKRHRHESWRPVAKMANLFFRRIRKQLIPTSSALA